MRKYLTLFTLLLGSMPLTAQVTTDSLRTEQTITLDEVTIQAERVVHTTEGLKLFPTASQLATSSSGYSLLQKLHLPNIKVNEVARTITAPEQLGKVQVRINDIPATTEELLALDPATVQSIDYLPQPGLRYGQDVGFVIHIHVRKPRSGYTIGSNLLQTLTARSSSDNLFARFNCGKSELALSYDFDWSDNRTRRYSEQSEYRLSDGTLYSISRRDLKRRNEELSHKITLKYSLADEGKYQLQATLSGDFSHQPVYRTERENCSAERRDTAEIRSREHSHAPQLDLYGQISLPHRQSLTANVTATYTGSAYDYQYHAPDSYAYRIDGKSWSMTSELLYENRLKPFTLSSGMRYDLQYADNVYTGNTLAHNRLHQSEAYLFGQLQGQIGAFSYKAGMGVSQALYRQGKNSYSYWLPRPNLSAGWQFSKHLSARYRFELSRLKPRPAYLSDVTVRNNEMELSVGNPDLRPARRTEHTLSIDYSTPRITNNFFAFYRHNAHTYMQQISRTTDTSGAEQFLFGRSNQGDINMLMLSNQTTLEIIPQKISLMLSGNFIRCFNYGTDYTHHHSAWTGSAELTVTLGQYTFTAFVDKGFEFLEGETWNRNCGATYLTASCGLGKWGRLSLFWQHPFSSTVTTYRSELLNRDVHRTISLRSGEMGNRISLNLSIRLNHGRNYKSLSRTPQKREVDTGLMKQEK